VNNGEVTNVVIAGLGGQGVLTCGDVLAQTLFLSGRDVKKAEIHGMSQRGGSVTCDVRFGAAVRSPMVPSGRAHFLLVLNDDQLGFAKPALAPDGVLVTPAGIDVKRLASKRCLNVAVLGRLSRHLDIEERNWHDAIRAVIPERLREANLAAFEEGRCAEADAAFAKESSHE